MKDLDKEILDLAKNATNKAKADLGFVKPIIQERKEFRMAPYDPEKDIKLVEFNPSEWGIKGTPSADQMDAILSNIINTSESNPLLKVKQSFRKLKEIIGPEMTSTGLPIKSRSGTSSIHARFATLQLKSTLYTIFHGYQPAQSGKIFESLIARIVGGYQSNKDDSRIEDLRDEAGNFISLKAIDRKTAVTGSAKNLALGIIAADKVKKGNGVIYLVCVKDIESSPLYFKAFSFLINKENFFNFVLGDSNISVEDINAASAKLLKTQINEATAEKGGDIEIDADKLRDAAILYAKKYLGWDETKTYISRFMYHYFYELYSAALVKSRQLTVDIEIGEEKKTLSLYDIFVNQTEKYTGMFPVMKELHLLFKDIPPETKGKEGRDNRFVNMPVYMMLKEEFSRLNVNVANLGKYLESDESLRDLYHNLELKKSFSYEKEKELTNILRQNSQKYKDIYKTFLEDEKVNEFFKFLDRFINTVDEYRYSVRQPETAKPIGQQLSDVENNPVEKFFRDLEAQEFQRVQKSDADKEADYAKSRKTWQDRRDAYAKNLEEGMLTEAASTSVSFSMPINKVLSLAAAVGADLDQDYETVVIDTGYLFESGTSEEENIKVLLEESFRAQHELKQRYIQYFGYKEIEGLQKAADSLEKQKNIISELEKLPISEDEPKTQVQNPSSIPESKNNKKQVLTDDFFNDIKKIIF